MSERRKCQYCERPVRAGPGLAIVCGLHGNAEVQYWSANWRVRLVESFDEYAAKRVRPVEEALTVAEAYPP